MNEGSQEASREAVTKDKIDHEEDGRNSYVTAQRPGDSSAPYNRPEPEGSGKGPRASQRTAAAANPPTPSTDERT